MLEIRELTKIYHAKEGTSVKALDSISLSLPSTGMVFILGKSGSGKSTLLNVVGGLDGCDEGEFIINGKSSKAFSPADFDAYRNTYVGFIFQEYNMLEDFSVAENVALALELQGKTADPAEIEAVLTALDLPGFGDRRINELSGGQKQRVAIARALIKKPEILMADEPTGALDSETGEALFKTLKKLSEEKLVLVVSHDRDFAERYGDRIIELQDGRIIADTATTEEVREEKRKGEEKALPLIRSRLPLKKATRMGLNSLRHKTLRLVVSIFLAITSFAMFGVTDAISAQNNMSIVTESMLDTGRRSIAVSKNTKQLVRDGYGVARYEYDPGGMDEEDVEALCAQTGLNFLPVLGDTEDFSFQRMLKSYQSKSNSLFNAKLNGFTVLTPEVIETGGFTLHGRLPEKTCEIVVTEFVYRQLNQYGFCNEKMGEEVAAGALTIDEGENALIGKHFSFLGDSFMSGDPIQFQVVGVLDTHFDYEYYAPFLPGFKDPVVGGLALEFRWYEAYGERDYGFHTLGFVVEEEMRNIRFAYLNGMSGAFSASYRAGANKTTHLLLHMTDVIDNVLVEAYSVLPFSKTEYLDITWLEEGKTGLGANEMLINERELYLYAPESAAIVPDRDALDALMRELCGEAAWNATDPTKSYLERLKAAGGAEIFTDSALVAYLESIYSYTFPERLTPQCGEQMAFFLDQCYEGVEEAVTVTIADIVSNTTTLFSEADVLLNELWKNKNMINELMYIPSMNLTKWNRMTEEEQRDMMIDFYLSGYVDEGKNTYATYSKDELTHMGNAAYLAMTGLTAEKLLSDLDCGIYQRTDERVKTGEIIWGYEQYETVRGEPQLLEKASYRVVGTYDAGQWYKLYEGTFICDAYYDYAKAWDEAASENEYVKEGIVMAGAGAFAYGVYDRAIVAFGENDREAVRLVAELTHQTGGEVSYTGHNGIYTVLEEYDEVIGVIQQLLFFVALGFAIFSALLFGNFIATSVSYHKREIGVLRALGARPIDVFKIFGSEALLVALINFMGATLLSWAAVGLFRLYMYDGGVHITLMAFGPRQILLLLGVSLLVALAASFVPVWRIARKKPVDAIKDR